jgi:hypothetical protein
VRARSPLRLSGTPLDPNATPHHSPVSWISASCRRRHSACASNGERQTPIQAISPEPRRSQAELISLSPMAATSIPIATHWSVDSDRYRNSAPTTGTAQSP